MFLQVLLPPHHLQVGQLIVLWIVVFVVDMVLGAIYLHCQVILLQLLVELLILGLFSAGLLGDCCTPRLFLDPRRSGDSEPAAARAFIGFSRVCGFQERLDADEEVGGTPPGWKKSPGICDVMPAKPICSCVCT